jgi:hypothetical protein
MPAPSRPRDRSRRRGHAGKAPAQTVDGGSAEHVVRLVQQELMETRGCCEPEPLGQAGIACDKPTERACRKVPRRQRPDRVLVPPQRYQSEFRGLTDMAIPRRKIRAADFRKIFDGDAGVERQPLQIGFFVDHALTDQHLISADAQFPGPRFGSSQQFRRQHPPQAIELIGRAFIKHAALIVIAGSRRAKASTQKCGSVTPCEMCRIPARPGRIPFAIPDMVRQGHATSSSNANDTRVSRRMVYKTVHSGPERAHHTKCRLTI